MRLIADQRELLDILEEQSELAQLMVGGTYPPGEAEEHRVRIRQGARLLRGAIEQVKAVSVNYLVGTYRPPEPEPTITPIPKKRLTRRGRILGWFEKNPGKVVTPSALGRILNDNKTVSFAQAIKHLLKAGDIVKQKRGQYQLTPLSKGASRKATVGK